MVSYMKYEEFGGLTISLLKILGKFKGKNLMYENFFFFLGVGAGGGGANHIFFEEFRKF